VTPGQRGPDGALARQSASQVRVEFVVSDLARRAGRGGNGAVRQAAGDGEGILPGGNDGTPLSTPRRPST
jgi:hypothetical protein